MRSNYMFRAAGFALLSCWLILASVVFAANAMSNAAIEFRDSYQSATGAKARRDLVIKAIDDAVIRRGISLSDVRVMFGDNLGLLGRNAPEQTFRAVVFFERVKRPPNPMMSALREGWYIDFVFASDGRVQYYSLSNLHK